MFLHSKKIDKPICFTEDILDVLSAKTGKDKVLLADIIKHNIAYLKKEIVSNNELVLVNFPNLGKMRFNYYLGLCVISDSGYSKRYKYISHKIEYLKNILKKSGGNDIKNFNKPLLFISIRKKEENVDRNIISSFYKYWKILEIIHNEDHKKYF